MKPEKTFVAERLAAQHCAELVRGARQSDNPLEGLAQFAEALAEVLAERLGQVFPGVECDVTAGAPEERAANVTEPHSQPLFNSTFLAGPREAMFHTSIPHSGAVSLVDIALGGSGKDCALGGAKLPLSAQLMLARFEATLAEALGAAFEFPGADSVRLKASGADAEAAVPFAGCRRTVIGLKLAIAKAEPFDLTLTFAGAAMASLFAGRAKAAASAPRGGVVSPRAEPFAGIPLPMKAVLVDMPIPVSALSALRPGTIIPVAVARSVPLFAGEQVVGHGTVGAMDDRNALQLTRISSSKEN